MLRALAQSQLGAAAGNRRRRPWPRARSAVLSDLARVFRSGAWVRTAFSIDRMSCKPLDGGFRMAIMERRGFLRQRENGERPGCFGKQQPGIGECGWHDRSFTRGT